MPFRFLKSLPLLLLVNISVAQPTGTRDVFRQNMEWLYTMKSKCEQGSYFSIHDQTCKSCDNGGEDYEKCQGYFQQKRLEVAVGQKNSTAISIEELFKKYQEQQAASQKGINIATAALVIAILGFILGSLAYFKLYGHQKKLHHGNPVDDPNNLEPRIEHLESRLNQLAPANTHPEGG